MNASKVHKIPRIAHRLRRGQFLGCAGCSSVARARRSNPSTLPTSLDVSFALVGIVGGTSFFSYSSLEVVVAIVRHQLPCFTRKTLLAVGYPQYILGANSRVRS